MRRRERRGGILFVLGIVDEMVGGGRPFYFSAR